MQKRDTIPAGIAPPAATGNAGVSFEAHVGAFYLVAMLADAEPRGLVGAKIQSVGFQQRIAGHPLDDIVVLGVNADGSPATLEIQAKRTMTFTASDKEFADVVGQMWQAAQKPDFSSGRYELAVAIARTTTRIEQAVQQVLHWARSQSDAKTFANHMSRKNFASDQMWSFYDEFRAKMIEAGAPGDDETVWTLLRRFQVLVFDLESIGSDYEHRARERCRYALVPEQASRAGDLWASLVGEVERHVRAAGSITRAELANKLATEAGYSFQPSADLKNAIAYLAESATFALGDITDDIGGAQLARSALIDEANVLLESAPVLYLKGAPGTGKSALMKQLASLLMPEGRIIVLRNGRIVPGGWRRMAHELDCAAPADALFNELGAGGGATLFVDNIDQIDAAGDRATVSDLLSAAGKSQGWRVVVTGGELNREWKAMLPAPTREQVAYLAVPEISDSEAGQLIAQNAALGPLLDNNHPARSIARNLFFLSRMVTLAGDQATEIATEIDLARIWWEYGGGRGEDGGRLLRLKTLRAMGSDILARPNEVATDADGLDSDALTELLRLDAIREHIKGARVAFRHDVLRDWTLGFMLHHQNPKLVAELPKGGPIPSSLARGLEITARLALESDGTGEAWLALLAYLSASGIHGSWRRPVLLALPRSENFGTHLQSLERVLLVDDAALLIELLRLISVVESEPIAKILARLESPANVPASLKGFAIPKGNAWLPLVLWLTINADRIPHKAVPDVTKTFASWLAVTQNYNLPFNAYILAALFEWLALVDEAVRPRSFRAGERLPPTLDIPHIVDVQESLRLAAFPFATLNRAAAAQYLLTLKTDRIGYGEFQSIMTVRGALAKAAPAAFVDFLLDNLFPVEKNDIYSSRSRENSVFDAYGYIFSPASPSAGSFLDILSEEPQEGLRLVRHIVEKMTDQRRRQYASAKISFPRLSIPFPEGTKSFEGDDSIYLWCRVPNPSPITTSALMALEAWGHAEIEKGTPSADVLSHVLGPDGSSLAFVAVAVDLALSHWDVMRDLVWPLAATPEILELDFHRHTRDYTGVDNFVFEKEPATAKVKRSDLAQRESRRSWLMVRYPDYVFGKREDTADHLRRAVEQAAREVMQRPRPEDEDPLHGLHAIAARTLRMVDRTNWRRVTIQNEDGSTSTALRYVMADDEERLFAEHSARSAEDGRHFATRSRIEGSLFDPKQSSPELVLEAIDWAKNQLSVTPSPPDDAKEEFDIEWDRRAIVMAASLAARDYTGVDRDEVIAWALGVLTETVREPSKERYDGNQIRYSRPAIAALGLSALYIKRPTPDLAATLLTLCCHPDHAVVNALGGAFIDLKVADEKLLRAMLRVMLISSRYERRRDDDAEYLTAKKNLQLDIDRHVTAELAWLNDEAGEPAWPHLPAWRTRPRQTLRLPGAAGREAVDPAPKPLHRQDQFADERRLGAVVSHLIPLLVGKLPEWLVPLTEKLMEWTLAANAPDENGRDVDGRPTTWNGQFFDYLGILCAALPQDQAIASFVAPTTALADDAFHSLAADLLRGFDRAVLSTDATKPQDATSIRRAFTARLTDTWSYSRLGNDKSFSCEFHAADAWSAMFFQQSGLPRSNRPRIPDNWELLPDFIPALTDLVIGAPASGYLAVLFLNLVETSPRAALLAHVVDAQLAWCGVYGADPSFWVSQNIGSRVCSWLKDVLPVAVLDEARSVSLMNSLDTLVQAGVSAAKEVEDLLMLQPQMQRYEEERLS